MLVIAILLTLYYNKGINGILPLTLGVVSAEVP